jgi:hypothetical protein
MLGSFHQDADISSQESRLDARFGLLFCLFGSSFTSWLFFFFSLFSLLRLEFKVTEEVEVRVLRLTAGRKNELLTYDLLDLIGWDSNLVI